MCIKDCQYNWKENSAGLQKNSKTGSVVDNILCEEKINGKRFNSV